MSFFRFCWKNEKIANCARTDVAKELELLQMLCLLGTASLRTQTYFRSSLLCTLFDR